MTDVLFGAWCSDEEITGRRKVLRLLREKDGAQAAAVRVLRQLVPEHYCDPRVIKRRLKQWGYGKTLSVLRHNLPQDKKARSGDIGEIVATEYVNRQLDFSVPIFRLRWRDDREMALRGDDIFAVRIDDAGKLHFLKGEVKSRQSLGAGVVEEAAEALRRHDGRPGPHTINFVVNRLSELGEDDLYEALEDYLTPKKIPKKRVTHLLFVLSGNNPKVHLEGYFDSYEGTVQQIVVGLRVRNHGDFVRAVFEGVSLA